METIYFYHSPIFWAYHGAILLLCLPWQPVLGIEADIFPKEPIIEVGTDLNITCTLRNETGVVLEMPTSSDIVWYKDQLDNPISSEKYQILNDMTSSISIVNATLSDAATYYCGLVQDTDVNEYQSSTVQVGYKPKPASNLHCASHNARDYYCQWIPQPTHIINESHIFQYRSYRRSWEDCPDYRSQNECFISEVHYKGTDQHVRVISSNGLGNIATTTSNFNPVAQTIPLPPRDLILTPISSTTLRASWQLPKDWVTALSSWLVYRLRWALEGETHNWFGETTRSTSFEISELQPYTKYVVQVSCRYEYHENPNAWGEWSNSTESQTGEAVPIGTVQNLQISEQNGTSDYERNVLISWLVKGETYVFSFLFQPVPEQEQRGPILNYSVTVSPHPDCQNQQNFTETPNITEVTLQGLEKFCSYKVKIKATNSIGSGPEAEGNIEDDTTIPLPPSVVRAEALSHQSVLVSWDKPTPVHGYISHYTVHWIKARGQSDLGQSRDVPSTNLSYRVDSLESYVRYIFRVSVTNRKGSASGWSHGEQATTEEWILEASPNISSIDPIANNPYSLLVNWKEVSEEDANGQILGYHLSYCRVAEESLRVPLCLLHASVCLEDQKNETFSKTAQNAETVTGLSPFSHYLIWISAFNSIGDGPTSVCPSIGSTSEGIPGQPRNVSITGSNATSIGLTWSPPLEKNGIIRNYTILVKSNSSTHQQEFYAGGVQSYLVEGLYGYVHYTLQVRACTIMCGNASDEVYQITGIGDPEKPGNFRVLPQSPNQVTASWEPPIHPNGPIDHYLVSYRPHKPSTPSPPIMQVSSVSMTSTLANRIDDWQQTTELTMSFEVDCSQAPFLFQVVAVNVIKQLSLVGEAAEYKLSECIEPDTTPSPLYWLILLCGIILLVFLLACLYYFQSKLGKSWPDPVYADLVKNKNVMQSVRLPKRVEKEEFDTILHVSPPEIEAAVIAAEEHTSPPSHCPMQTSMMELTESLYIKHDIGGKHTTLRTISIDSGVPPSPQDQLDFSSSEDIFDLEAHEIPERMQDTSSFGNPSVMMSHRELGGKGGHPSKRSMSLSSSDRYHGALPAIEEDKFWNLIIDDNGRVKGTSTDWLLGGKEDDEVKKGPLGGLSKILPQQKQPSGAFLDQISPVTEKKVGGSAEGNHHMGPGSSSGTRYVKSEINELSLKSDDGYASCPTTSVVAIPLVGQHTPKFSEQSLTSSYVSKESLARSTLGISPDLAGKEGILSGPSVVVLTEQLSSQPHVQTGGMGYVQLGNLSNNTKEQADAGTEEQESSSWNVMPLLSPSPYLSSDVRGVDLKKMLEIESELSESSASPAPSVCIPGKTEEVETQDLSEVTLDFHVTEAKQSIENVRMSTDGSSSSSGYTSDNRKQVSGNVVVSTECKEKSDNLENLISTSAESGTNSDVIVMSGMSVHQGDNDDCPIPVSDTSVADAVDDFGNKNTDASFVKYLSDDGQGVGFVNDYPSPSEVIDLFNSMTPCSNTRGHSDSPQSLQEGGGNRISGYVSHSAVPDAESKCSQRSDNYQVPRRDGGERIILQVSRKGDDGYVPFDGDSGYVLRVEDRTQTREEYIPMSPILESKRNL